MGNISFRWRDAPHQYGVVSQFFHWAMALVFAYLFIGLGIELLLDLHASDLALIPTHGDLGATLFVLSIGRTCWALVNLSNRYASEAKWPRILKLVHILFYVLMIAIPSLGLLFFYAHGEPVDLFGFLHLFENVSSSTAMESFLMMSDELTGQSLHGLLGWGLMTLIGLHIVMVGVHQFFLRDGIIKKMWRP